MKQYWIFYYDLFFSLVDWDPTMFGLDLTCTATFEGGMIQIGLGSNVAITDNCDPRTMFGDTDEFQSATRCFCEDGSCQILMDCTLADLLCALESSATLAGNTNLKSFFLELSTRFVLK